ncbi:MAG: inner membrane protein [Halieaceae bacterium]|jgi:inner membrane protein
MRQTINTKLIAIVILTVAMLIPLKLIEGKVSERQQYRQQAAQRIADSWTGAQTLLTPVLVIPFERVEEQRQATETGFIYAEKKTQERKILVPDSVELSGELVSEMLKSGLYEVPVYRAALSMRVRFSKQKLAQAKLDIATESGVLYVDQKPYVSIFLTDPRGINDLPSISWGNKVLAFSPGSKLPGAPTGVHVEIADWSEHVESDLEFELSLNLRGSHSLSVIPAADMAEVMLVSDWPHPEFTGAFLPLSREINEDGFSAEWRLNRFATQIAERLAQCRGDKCEAIYGASFGVNLIDPVDVYVQSERSVKYGILFVGLSFVFFFVFEQFQNNRIHPIQYGLVGLSLSVFFLLLLSLSEHVGFSVAYLVAVAGCTGINYIYLSGVLRSASDARRFSCALLALYGALYLIIRAEDVALLMGSLLVFAVLAVAMIATRRIDWYESVVEEGKG